MATVVGAEVVIEVAVGMVNEELQPYRDVPDPNGVGPLSGMTSKQPHGVRLEDIDGLEDILVDQPYLRPAFEKMFSGHLAQSTHKTYDWVLKDFKMYCDANDLQYPKFQESAVYRYLAYCVIRERTFAFWRQFLPALKDLEKSIARRESVLSPGIEVAIKSMIRQTAATRPTIRKATPFGRKQIKKLIDYVIYDKVDNNLPIDPDHFRSLMRAIVIFFSWLRFSDYKDLHDKNFVDRGGFVKFTLDKTKQDQFYCGSASYIPATGGKYCPVRFIRLYFEMFNLEFEYAGPVKRYLNFRLLNSAGQTKALLTTTLSYTTAVERMRFLFEAVGLPARLYTETSFKAGGVSDYLQAGNSLEACMINGRWKGINTPLFYLRDKEEYRVNLARALPPIDED